MDFQNGKPMNRLMNNFFDRIHHAKAWCYEAWCYFFLVERDDRERLANCLASFNAPRTPSIRAEAIACSMMSSSRTFSSRRYLLVSISDFPFFIARVMY